MESLFLLGNGNSGVEKLQGVFVCLILPCMHRKIVLLVALFVLDVDF